MRAKRNVKSPNVGFEIEYYGKYSWEGVNGLVRKNFSTIKSLTQFVRRNGLTEYRRFYNGELITFVSNEMVTLSRLEKLVSELKKPIPKKTFPY